MTFDFDLSPAARVAEAIAGRTTATDWLLEAGVTAVALATGWLVARALRGRVEANPRWKFGKGGFERLAFPLLALAVAGTGANMLAGRYDTAVVDIAVSLLVAYPGIPLAVYVPAPVIPGGGLQQPVLRTPSSVAASRVARHLTSRRPELGQRGRGRGGQTARRGKGDRVGLNGDQGLRRGGSDHPQREDDHRDREPPYLQRPEDLDGARGHRVLRERHRARLRDPGGGGAPPVASHRRAGCHGAREGPHRARRRARAHGVDRRSGRGRGRAQERPP